MPVFVAKSLATKAFFNKVVCYIFKKKSVVEVSWAQYNDVIMGAIASNQPYDCDSTVYSGADQRKYQRSVSLAFVRGIHRWPVNSPHKWPVTRKMFPIDDVIMGEHMVQIVVAGVNKATISMHCYLAASCSPAMPHIRYFVKDCMPFKYPIKCLFDPFNNIEVSDKSSG